MIIRGGLTVVGDVISIAIDPRMDLLFRGGFTNMLNLYLVLLTTTH